MPSDSHVNDCGHSYTEMVWDDDIKKYVCKACIKEQLEKSPLAKLFEERSIELPEAYR